MSQSSSERSETPPEARHQPRGFSDEELSAQARAAAEQALQLARLAEESARLARHLNEQVAARAGHSLAVPAPAVAVEAGGSGALLSAPGTARRVEDRPTSNKAAFSLAEGVHATADVEYPIHVREIPGSGRRSDKPLKKARRSWNSILLSALLHGSVLVVLGLLTFVVRSDDPINTILASFTDTDASVEEVVPVDEPVEDAGVQQQQPVPVPEEPVPESPPPVEVPAPQPPPPAPAAAEPNETPEVAEDPAPADIDSQPVQAPPMELTLAGSRSDEGKAFLLQKYGGTADSESAVGHALEWFVSVQRADGSWDFNDVGQSSHAGTVNNPMGATSHVLLSFLGAGQTHRKGKYRKQVGAGLNFLLKYGQIVPAGADLRGPNVEEHHNFYVQGAAAMALCEAYSMTKDRRLKAPAQGAVNFIMAAQDPQGGGWRYKPFEPGCTSVTTLQLTALVSAKNAGLNVPSNVLDGLRHYYTTVQCDGGPTGRYCYRAEKLQYSTASTAQATLGRMYLGATRDDEDLRAAIALLDDRGPYENRYYCYYATQALKNWGGLEWERWNQSLREELIRTQIADEGPAFGSWTPLQRAETDVAGGRLFATALSVMTLEVYYRYLPLYEALSDTDDNEVAADDPMPQTANVP